MTGNLATRLSVAVMSVLPLSAQFVVADDSPTVVAQGTSVVERQPEVLRMQMEIYAKAPDLKTALSQLAKRRSDAEKLLVELGASDSSLKFGTPHVSAQAVQRQRQMRMMLAQRLRTPGARSRSDAAPAEPVTLALQLTAEWPIGSTAPDDLLVKTHDLQERIVAADIAGKKELEQPTEEEEELAAEMQGMYVDPSEQQAGEAVFVYVAKIPQDVRREAIAKAFDKAKATAADLAQAAGAAIGDLRELRCVEQVGPTVGGLSGMGGMYYDSMAYRLAQQAAGMFNMAEQTEAVGAEPDGVRYGITIDAKFGLK
ncbi:MAG: SIMPL domain-containing protein [Pirellulales bacterium]